MRRRTQYDIIEADAIYPWRSHAGMLYSREFFEQVYNHLTEDGLMAQWAPTQRARSTFLSVFPYVADVGNDVLIGSKSPINYDQNIILERLKQPEVERYLLDGQVDLEAMRAVLESHTPVIWTPDVPRSTESLNSDLFPRDEYYLNQPLG